MQAFIISAYKDFPRVRTIVSSLAGVFPCYVHVDASGEITEAETRQLDAIPNVHAYRKYRINWGSFNLLRAHLFLCREALKDPDITYFHLMSAQDYPILSQQEMHERFDKSDRIYCQMIRVADYPELRTWHEHYHFQWLINYRDPSEKTQNLVGRIDRFQDALHIRRKLNPTWKGLGWVSFPRDACEYLVADRRSLAWLKKMRFTYTEEFFFQNVFTGTAFEARIEPFCQHFDIWDKPERGLPPCVLQMEDLPRIEASGCAFARKVEADSELYKVLEARWNGQPAEQADA